MKDHPLWRWADICDAVAVPRIEGPDVSGVAIDSRRVTPGDLFVALPGDPGPRFHVSQRSGRDGHDYIDAAMEAGAVGVLAHDGVTRAIPQLQVRDTLDALWQWARAARARLGCPVVAVTGSSGKTTTKGFLAAALDAVCTPGSLNNHLGVPLSLVQAPEQARAAVFEVGTSHPGEIAPLAELVRPDVAVVLNVHPAHAEFFATPDELRKEKLSIYKGLSNKGHLIVEDKIDLDGVSRGPSISTFGESEQADVRLLTLADGVAQYRIDGRTVSARVPGGGWAQALCLAATLAVIRALGADLGAGTALPLDLVPMGRGNIVQVAGVTLIDDSYNANPESVGAALEALAARPERTLAVLGDMRELGKASKRYHQQLAEHCAGVDRIICVGTEMAHLYERLPAAQQAGRFIDSGEAVVKRVLEVVDRGDWVLVKGSNRIFWVDDFVGRLRAALEATGPGDSAFTSR